MLIRKRLGPIAAGATHMAAKTNQNAFRLLSADPVGVDAFPEGSPVLRLHRYWRSIAPSPDTLPGRQHVDPLDIGPWLMPWIFLMDVIREHGAPFDYLFRLVGTSSAALVGRDATGQRASEVFGRVDAGFMLATFDQTVAGGAPTFWIATVPHDRIGEVTIHRGLFPLARDGRTVDMLLCLSAPWPAG